MEEALVIFACLNNTGCSETTSQYYLTHPEFKEIVQAKEDQIKQIAGPIITEYIAPIVWFSTGKESTIKIVSCYYLNFSYNKQVVLFKREF